MHKVPTLGCTFMDTPERRVLDLSSELPFLPVLGRSRSSKVREGAVEHRHARCMELTFCERGSVKFDCEGRVWSLLPGNVFVTQPKDAHRLRMNPKGAHLWWVFFRVPARGEALPSLTPAETRWLVNRLQTLPTRLFPSTDAIRDGFRDLFAVVDREPASLPSRSLRLKMSAVSLLLAIADAGHAGTRVPRDDALRGIIDRMRRAPEVDYVLDDLLAETRLSQSSLAFKFKQLVGLPPHAFLIACRIRRAKELLAQTTRSVLSIASELKFSSSQHFATRFKQEAGLSPLGWRKRNR